MIGSTHLVANKVALLKLWLIMEPAINALQIVKIVQEIKITLISLNVMYVIQDFYFKMAFVSDKRIIVH